MGVQIGTVSVGNDLPFVLIGGPYQVEAGAGIGLAILARLKAFDSLAEQGA